MNAFVLNRHGRLVLPSSIMPQLDFSAMESLDQLDHVIRRDFETKAPSGTEILDRVRSGEILVCPITAPSWAPVFSRIQGAVSDIGGIMSHAAIVSREYGLPAVVGTGFGTKRIQDGQRVRVDGNSGVVTVLDT